MICTCVYVNIHVHTWRFPEVGVPHLSSMGIFGCSMKSTIKLLGYPHEYGNPWKNLYIPIFEMFIFYLQDDYIYIYIHIHIHMHMHIHIDMHIHILIHMIVLYSIISYYIALYCTILYCTIGYIFSYHIISYHFLYIVFYSI